jgi:hypothetical protein
MEFKTENKNGKKKRIEKGAHLSTTTANEAQ